MLHDKLTILFSSLKMQVSSLYMQAINGDISGYSPDHGSMHINAPNASISGSTASYAKLSHTIGNFFG